MAYTTITEKDKASTVYEEKKLLDTDVNQIRDAIQLGTKDIKPYDIVGQGTQIKTYGDRGFRFNDITQKMQFTHDGSTWADVGGDTSQLSGTAGEALVAGNVVMLNGSGKFVKSDGTKAQGIVTSTSVALNDPVDVQTTGTYTTTGLTAGTTYFVQSNGTYSSTQSNIVLGYAMSTTQMLVFITNMYYEATTRADEDGFVYIDTTNHTTNSVSEVLKRTFTFNKAVDYVRVHMNCYGGNSTYAGQIGFKRNGTLIPADNKIGFSPKGGYSYGGLLENYSDDYIYVQGGNGNDGTTFFINQSFAIGDTLTMYLKVANAAVSITVTNLVIEGINNKTTDTTWVSVS